MNTLDSPLEALALDYLSFSFLTAVNNVWTWIAVITTAAVSIWRIKASSPPARGNSLDYSSPQPSVVQRLADEPASTSSEYNELISLKPSASVFRREGSTSGKFTVYFQEEDCRNNDVSVDGDDDDDDDVNLSGERREWLGNGWEVTMEMRKGDMGWYRYQDMTVLDGNVVRLWDGCSL